MPKGVLFVIVAPSGAGKTTLIERVRRLFPELLYSISCTTRPPRVGEMDGVDYYFLDKDRFKEMIKQGRFLEWKEVHDNLYGTPAEPVLRALENGNRMILDIDVEGAKEVFKRVPQAVGIFVSAPNIYVLEERLRSRGTDTEETIETRLANAIPELASADIFQHQIINDDLYKALKELAEIIRHGS